MEGGGGIGIRKVPGCPQAEGGWGGSNLKDSEALDEVRGTLISALETITGMLQDH